MARHWSINGRFLTQPLSGVQRYAQEIVRGLDALIGEGHPLARDLELEVLTPPGAVRPLELSAVGIRSAGKHAGHAWEQLSLPKAPRGGLLSLANTGPVAARKHIVCIHDVNTRLAPGSYSPQFRALYRLLVPALGRSAARVATVSHFSADQIAGFGIARKAKMAVIPNGHEHALAWQARHSLTTERAGGRNTILMLGSPAPHKNMQMLLGVADQLAGMGLRLAIAGKVDGRVFSKTVPQVDAQCELAGRRDGRRTGRDDGRLPVPRLPLADRGLRLAGAGSHGARLPGGLHRPRQPAGGLRRSGAVRLPDRAGNVAGSFRPSQAGRGPARRADRAGPCPGEPLSLEEVRRDLSAAHGPA
jgi:glycosyltransferase involved in cell wall biosynthesis